MWKPTRRWRLLTWLTVAYLVALIVAMTVPHALGWPNVTMQALTALVFFGGLCLMLAGLVMVAVQVLLFSRGQGRQAEGCCRRCGYDLRGTVLARRDACPECGARFFNPAASDDRA